VERDFVSVVIRIGLALAKLVATAILVIVVCYFSLALLDALLRVFIPDR
jgi:hypothetical protein